MGKMYDTITDPAIIEFCLNCKRKRCIGDCEALKKEKQRIIKKQKEERKK